MPDRRFTLLIIVLITAIVSGTVMTVMKVIPSDTMTHMLATIVGIVGGALFPSVPQPAVQKTSLPPPGAKP
jgi:hypothetical protein